jgi:hypothetical protein
MCFHTLLQVLILSNLPCHGIAQEFTAFLRERKRKRLPKGSDVPKKKNGSWAAAGHNNFQCGE